ncbi:MAG: FCD domain-containing protein, partial [Pirellulales bacterium]|nr:FCD domain-containing protein [Pirellulales bacterium]
ITDASLSELEGHLKELNHLCEVICSVGDNEEARLAPMRDWMCVDLNFHMALLRAARNQSVIRALSEANVLTRMFSYRTDLPTVWRDSKFIVANYTVHSKLFEAIQQHDAKAAKRAMAIHMKRAEKNTLARFDWLEQERLAGSQRSNEFPDSLRQQVLEIERRNINRGETRPDSA